MGRSSRALTLAALLAASVATSATAEILDRSGAPVPGTSTASPTAQLVGSPTLVSTLFGPFTAPVTSSVASPEDDLQRALDDIVQATSATVAEDARTRAIAILEGATLTDRTATYSGIGLLNHGGAKIKSVAAGLVDVKVVRFGQHVVSDTWLIDSIPQNTTWQIRYTTMQLGGDTNGMFNPTPLLADGGVPIGGLHSVLSQLSLDDDVATGTTQLSRFTQVLQQGGTANQPLMSRALVERRTVTMPPGRYTSYILEPNLRAQYTSKAEIASNGAYTLEEDLGAHHEALATFVPLTATRAAVTTPIAQLAAIAPEKQVWQGLTAFGQVTAGNLADAKTLASGLRGQVGAMRVRNQLPPGVAPTPGVDLDVALLNNESYASNASMQVPTDRPITVRVQNHDGVAHAVRAIAVSGRQQVYGAMDWGRFSWNEVALAGPATLGPGESATYTLTVPASAFTLVMGDSERGSQGMHHIALDRGPLMEAFTFPGSTDRPLHQAFDASGRIWASVPAADSIARLTPAADFAGSALEVFLIPGGVRLLKPDPLAVPFLPGDVAVDQKGKVFVTAPGRNAIIRLDPNLVQNGTSNGVTVLPLAPCAVGECRLPPGPPLPGPPSREPAQLVVHEDAEGNTLVFFTEAAADAIGVLRVTPAGTVIGSRDFSCGCTIPLAIEVDASGDVWFSQTVENRIGRLRLSRSRPYSGNPQITHYLIKSASIVNEPDLGLVDQPTSLPHSFAFGADGKLRLTELATGKLGVLDPAAAVPGTFQGLTEIDLQKSDFGGTPQPADLVVDASGRTFVADEYGDMIRSVVGGGLGPAFRTAERQSLTDEPLVDAAGNLYVVESAAGLITRYRGVAAPTPLTRVVGQITVETHGDAVQITGLTDATSAMVEVLRGGAVVSRGDTAISGGSGRVGTGGGPWDLGDRNPVAAGDVVRVTPSGSGPLAPISIEVASLTAAAGGPGLTGSATFAGEALFGSVAVRSASGATVQAPITGTTTGAFAASISPDGATLTWTRGLTRARVSTLSAIGPEPIRPAGGNGPATPAPGTSNVPGVTASGACTLRPALRKKWVPKRGTAQKVVRACLGKPNKVGVKGIKRAKTLRWTYTKRRLIVVLKNGKVQAVIRIKVTKKPVKKAVKVTKERVADAPVALRPAMALVDVDPADLGYRLVSAPPRPDVRAQVDHARRTITVFLDPAEATHLVAHDIAHEIGHAVDVATLTDTDRTAYLVRRGAPGAAWSAPGTDDYASGAGDFAETFALCHAASPDFRSTLAPRPGNACELVHPSTRSSR